MPTVTLGTGARLFFRETAGEPPVGTATALLVHRAGGSSRDWLEVFRLVGSARRLVAIDLPGHGKSPGPHAPTVEAMADHVGLACQALRLELPVLVGHSMGGAAALEQCLRRPRAASGLLLVASGATLRVARAVMITVRDHFQELPQLMGGMAFSDSTSRVVVERSLATLFDARREVALADLEACNGWSAESRVRTLEVPVRLLAGADDMLAPPRLARRLAERAPTARVEVLPETGHMIPQERPEAVAQAILEATDRSGGADA